MCAAFEKFKIIDFAFELIFSKKCPKAEQFYYFPSKKSFVKSLFGFENNANSFEKKMFLIKFLLITILQIFYIP